ncbi:MAG: hypothetical protein D6737_05920 [Chloroflexi bacterium]|nr:MAG: hypothetical protein D6737_05920 [Chloroflexota bacterium]
MRMIVLICLLLMTPIGSAAHAQDDFDSAACVNPLRIATWNIENFNVSRLDDSDSADALVATWAAIDADIVALQEIGSQEAIDSLLTLVNAMTGRDYQAVLSYRGGGSQKVGFAWDSETVSPLTEAAQIDSLRLRGTRLRPGFTMDFRFGAYDFTLVTLHLKATQETPSQRIREAQMTLLAQWFDERPPDADEDVIILGDYNDLLDAAPLQPISEIFFFATSELPDDAVSFIGAEHRSLIDHIALSPGTGASDEFCSIVVFDPAQIDLTEAEFQQLASDHLPLVVTMTTAS